MYVLTSSPKCVCGKFRSKSPMDGLERIREGRKGREGLLIAFLSDLCAFALKRRWNSNGTTPLSACSVVAKGARGHNRRMKPQWRWRGVTVIRMSACF